SAPGRVAPAAAAPPASVNAPGCAPSRTALGCSECCRRTTGGAEAVPPPSPAADQVLGRTARPADSAPVPAGSATPAARFASARLAPTPATPARTGPPGARPPAAADPPTAPGKVP